MRTVAELRVLKGLPAPANPDSEYTNEPPKEFQFQPLRIPKVQYSLETAARTALPCSPKAQISATA